MASKIIEFDVVFNYADQEEGIEIPLALNANGRSLMTVGFVDTGCGACLFGNEIGMDLGIDRLIESRSSPERVIRSAISQCRLVANTGDGKYWWYLRLLKGSRVRVPLIASDLELRRIVFDDDARDLLWPSFFASHEQTDRKPIELRFGAGDCVSLPLENFGGREWGTTGSLRFWNWLRACEVKSGDALILEAIDAEAKSYRVDLEAASVRDEFAIRRRTAEVEQEAREHMWKRRAFSVAVWDLAKHLLATGCYKRPVPPDPISPIWSRVDMQIGLLRVYDEEYAGQRRRSRKRGRKKGRSKAPEVYQLKVTLGGFDRPIWRRLLVSGDTMLGDLHWILQLSIGMDALSPTSLRDRRCALQRSVLRS